MSLTGCCARCGGAHHRTQGPGGFARWPAEVLQAGCGGLAGQRFEARSRLPLLGRNGGGGRPPTGQQALFSGRPKGLARHFEDRFTSPGAWGACHGRAETWDWTVELVPGGLDAPGTWRRRGRSARALGRRPPTRFEGGTVVHNETSTRPVRGYSGKIRSANRAGRHSHCLCGCDFLISDFVGLPAR